MAFRENLEAILERLSALLPNNGKCCAAYFLELYFPISPYPIFNFRCLNQSILKIKFYNTLILFGGIGHAKEICTASISPLKIKFSRNQSHPNKLTRQ
jgi:hypothetical protein